MNATLPAATAREVQRMLSQALGKPFRHDRVRRCVVEGLLPVPAWCVGTCRLWSPEQVAAMLEPEALARLRARLNVRRGPKPRQATEVRA